MNVPSAYIFLKRLYIFSGRSYLTYPAVLSKMFHNFTVSVLMKYSMCPLICQNNSKLMTESFDVVKT